jgi:hypothetical protein
MPVPAPLHTTPAPTRLGVPGPRFLLGRCLFSGRYWIFALILDIVLLTVENSSQRSGGLDDEPT